MDIRKIKRGDRLQLALVELAVGESVKVPYRHYSENSIRATTTKMKMENGLEYNINAQSNVAAIITRVV